MNYKKLTGAGLISVGIFLSFVLALPQYQELVSIKEAKDAQQAALDKKQSLLDKLSSLKQQIQQRRIDVDKLNNILPKEKRVQDVVVNVEEISRESGISIKTLKTALIQTGLQDSRYKVIQVEVDAVSQYKSMVDFVRSLEKNLRIFDIQGLTVSLDMSANAAGSLNFNTKFYTYFVN